MRAAAFHRAALAFALAAPLLSAIGACHREPASLEALAEFTFDDLAPGEPLVAELPAAPGKTLLVRVEGFEADFESSVIGASGDARSTARLPHVRAGPVFHVIESPSESEPARVAVRPQQFTRDARMSVRVFELPAESRRDLARIEAYRAFEAGTQSTLDESPELWRQRAARLKAAAAGLRKSGDIEARLWAEYQAAFVDYFPLADYARAAKAAQAVQRQAREEGLQLIELMAMQLEGQALIEREAVDTPEAAGEKAEQAQEVLARAAVLAAELGHGFEEAWALNSRGIGYFYQAHYQEAEAQYSKALAIAVSLSDVTLEQQVRGNLALVHERQGDLFGALAELQAINAQLRTGGATAELAHNWSELARLYQRLYAFPEAIQAQERAFDLWRKLNSAEGKGGAGLSLAYAYYAMGNMRGALAALESAIGDLETARYGRGLRTAYGLTADIQRGLGQFEAMAEARDREADYLTSDAHRAWYEYKKGLDRLAGLPGDPSQADRAFEWAATLAGASGETGLQLLAGLQRCAITAGLAETCAAPDFERALAAWLPQAPPSQALEARYLQARNLDQLGRTADAWAAFDALIDEILLYRHTLPGVLGAWYWEGRARIFEAYMALALKEFEGASPRPVRSLVAFNRLLNASLGAKPPDLSGATSAEADPLQALRNLLAQLEGGDAAHLPDLRQEIDRRLLELGSGKVAAASMQDAQALLDALEDLPGDSVLLAYYVSEGESWAWRAGPSGVQLYPLAPGGELKARLLQVRSGLRVVGNDARPNDLARAGELLIGPIADELPESVYLLAAGPLVGIPFEALRHGGRYFGQQHSVINVLSLEALGRLGDGSAGSDSWDQLVLAGDPTGGVGAPVLPAAGSELDEVARLFQGRSITRSSGADLGLDLFYDKAVASADLIHISSHARLDLEYPELSRIMLSSDRGEAAFLTPLDVRRISLEAELVVLSACETTGLNRFSFDGNLGFVQAFLDAGTGAVIATLWPVADAFAAEFMPAVYAAMLQGMNGPAALAQVKRRYISDTTAGDNLDWPAFQLYVN